MNINVTHAVGKLMDTDSTFESFVVDSFDRFTRGDWGDLEEPDRKLNDEVLQSNTGRVFARYEGRPTIHIVMEPAKSQEVTVMFADEY